MEITTGRYWCSWLGPQDAYPRAHVDIDVEHRRATWCWAAPGDGDASIVYGSIISLLGSGLWGSRVKVPDHLTLPEGI